MTCTHFGGGLQILIHRQGSWQKHCLVCGDERPAQDVHLPEEAGKASALAVADMESRRFRSASETFAHAAELGGDPRCHLAALLCDLGISWCGDEYQPTFSGEALPRIPLAEHPRMQALRSRADSLSPWALQGIEALIKQLQDILTPLEKAEGLTACDVFLCYRRTPGNVNAALKLCQSLEQQGLRVFCADHTTRGKTQEEFEAHVCHALRTAEHMVIFPGDGADAVSPWMRNELIRAACPMENRYVCSEMHRSIPDALGTVLPMEEIRLRLKPSDTFPAQLWEQAVQALADGETLPRAMRLMERSSAHGDLRARLLLATLYEEGVLAPADPARAKHYHHLTGEADAKVRQAVFAALEQAEKARRITRRRAAVYIAADVSAQGLQSSRALLKQLLTDMQADRRLAGCEAALAGYDRHARCIEAPKPLTDYGLPETAASLLHTLTGAGREQSAYAAKGLRLCAALHQSRPDTGDVLPLAVLLSPRAGSDDPAALEAARASVADIFPGGCITVTDADQVPGCIRALRAALR